MAERTRRPAPRTLAATPPPSSRAPQATQYQARFPSLMAVLAGGALVPACHAPECGTTRGDELQAHGPESMNAARHGQAANAIREIGVALGVVAHTSTPGIMAPGEIAPVTTLPRPQQPEPVVQAPGAMPVVQPTPPPPTPPIAPEGGVRTIDPTPPTPPRHPNTQVRPHEPRPRVLPSGGARRVDPTPPTAVPGGLGMVSPVPARRPG